MTPKISRRQALKSGLGLASSAIGFPLLAPTRREIKDDRVLVVVELAGGNDGLSMVVPHGEDAYHRVRRQTRHDPTAVLKLNDQVGLNPTMNRLRAAYEEEALGVVLGTGYPNPNRSHFESMDIWHVADERGQFLDRGWLGTFADAELARAANPNAVVAIGNASPLALAAKRVKPVAFRNPSAYRFAARPEQMKAFDEVNRSGAGADGAGPTQGESNLDFLRRVSRQAKSSSYRIRRAIQKHRTRANFGPGGRLGQDLRIASALIARQLGTRVIYCSMGGFDTHVNQKNRHDNLMRQLDAALGAFRQELKAHGCADRVVTMVFSEFGRRVQENASGGTDHGTAGPMLLLGEGLRGGVHGVHPSFDDLDDRGDLKMTTDFRSVYHSLIHDWMRGAPPATVAGIPKIAGLFSSAERG
jgi:uncharacterized protein (DUF1501 family)